MNKEVSRCADDDAWEPGGTLGNDERYIRRADPETERRVDQALGFRIRFRCWLRKQSHKK